MKLLLCLIILVFICITNAININVNQGYHRSDDGYHIEGDSSMRDTFNHWAKKHSKIYKDSIDMENRFSNFKENMKKNIELNSIHGGKAKFESNSFSDLSEEEFSNFHLNKAFKGKPTHLRNSIKPQPTPHHSLINGYKEMENGDLTELYSIDWRKKGLVTPVKDQGQCGSCYIFSAVEQIETAWIKAGNKPILLSEQQAVDCDPYDGQCGGGDPYTVYEYFSQVGGVSTNAQYPYTATDGTCVNMSRAVPVVSYHYVTQGGDENTLIKTIVNEGPVSICVDASTWQSYSGGVITTGCGQNIDHCVQVVGLEVDKTDPSNPVQYYIIRNSWGTDWGIDGYIYVATGSDLCGITYESTMVDV
ncbi:hypothetical protein ACTFIZ_009470 [Dictyostelium cf. discoideum]